MTRQKIEALPVHRTAQILSGNLDVVRYRTCRVAARFLKGRVVRAVWVQVELGFKWSSQHLERGGCDGCSEAAFGSVWARRVAVAWPALGGTA